MISEKLKVLCPKFLGTLPKKKIVIIVYLVKRVSWHVLWTGIKSLAREGTSLII